MSSKKLSVLMPVYNGARFLRAAVDSVLAQEYQNFEFMILNDASQDETPALLAQISDPRVRIVHNEQNLGIARTLNRGLSLASGEYIARMDADDICLPMRFARQVTFLDQHPDVGVVGTGVDVINEHGAFVRTDHPLATTDGAVRWLNLVTVPFYHPTVMLRREHVLAAGNYDPAFTATEDRELWDRLLDATHGANLPDALLRLRIHTQNVSVTRHQQQRMEATQITQRAAAKLLGIEVADAPCRILVNESMTNADEAAAAIALLTQLYSAFTIKHNLRPGERHFVRWDYAHRLFRLARKWPTDARMRNALLRAGLTSPTLIFDWLAKQAGRRPDIQTKIQKS